MRSLRFRNQAGFSLVELSIVMIISGLMVSAGFSAYGAYLKQVRATESYEKLRMIESSIALFASYSKRLPCPSNPTIPITEPGSGMEISRATCDTLMTSTPGTCMEGVCKANGRDADGDGNPDPVLIGGIPYSAVRSGSDPVSTTFSSIAAKDALDPWGYQMTYAVSGVMTLTSGYLSSNGAINVETEAGVPLVTPAGSAHYVAIAHGDNHMGAYTAQGVVGVACAPGATKDADNCDGNSTYISGLRALGAGTTYFDDVLIFSAYTISSLWDFVGTSPDIYNRNPGNVGVGTANPTQRLEVGDGTSFFDVTATKVTSEDICSQIGGRCWSADILSAPKATGLPIGCPDTGTPGMIDVVVAIKFWDHDGDPLTPDVFDPVASCGQVPMIVPGTAQSCTNPGEFVLGFTSTGTIQCGTP